MVVNTTFNSCFNLRETLYLKQIYLLKHVIKHTWSCDSDCVVQRSRRSSSVVQGRKNLTVLGLDMKLFTSSQKQEATEPLWWHLKNNKITQRQFLLSFPIMQRLNGASANEHGLIWINFTLISEWIIATYFAYTSPAFWRGVILSKRHWPRLLKMGLNGNSTCEDINILKVDHICSWKVE